MNQSVCKNETRSENGVRIRGEEGGMCEKERGSKECVRMRGEGERERMFG